MEDEAIGNLITEGLGSPAPTPTPEPVAPAAPATADTAAPATPAAALTPAAQPSSPAAPIDGAKAQEAIPLATFLDMRDELKRTKANLDKLQKQGTPPPAAPSFKDDPDGLAAYVAEQTNRVANGTRFEVSEMTARDKHGDQVVTAAMDWGMKRAEESPVFAAEFLKQPNPIAWIVKQQKRAALLEEMGDDEDAFIRARAAKLGLGVAPAAAATAQPAAQATAPASQQLAPQAQPTRSLAAAPSAGGPNTVPSGPMAAFDAVFPGP